MPTSPSQFLFQSGGGLAPADQDTMEGATQTAFAVTPGSQNWHPGNCKAWVLMSTTGGTPSLITGFNVSSLTDVAVGEFRVNFTTSFSSANYGFVGMGVHLVTSQLVGTFYGATLVATSSQFPLNVLTTSGQVATDPLRPVGAAFYGDQ